MNNKQIKTHNDQDESQASSETQTFGPFYPVKRVPGRTCHWD